MTAMKETVNRLVDTHEKEIVKSLIENGLFVEGQFHFASNTIKEGVNYLQERLMDNLEISELISINHLREDDSDSFFTVGFSQGDTNLEGDYFYYVKMVGHENFSSVQAEIDLANKIYKSIR